MEKIKKYNQCDKTELCEIKLNDSEVDSLIKNHKHKISEAIKKGEKRIDTKEKTFL